MKIVIVNKLIENMNIKAINLLGSDFPTITLNWVEKYRISIPTTISDMLSNMSYCLDFTLIILILILYLVKAIWIFMF